jgi:hypothetical protein
MKMFQKVSFALLVTSVMSSNVITVNEDHASGGGSVNEDTDNRAMEQVFARTDEIHQASMASISASMTLPGALEMLKKSNLSSPRLALVTDIAAHSNLRKQPKGYSGLDGARNLLNDMIYESMSKYDTEVAKCTEYYSKQCAAMEACRGQISASNYIAANSRALILDAQATINKCEVDIPATKLELKQHLLKCKHELGSLNTRLKIVMGDIAVMTMILEMTDCEKKLLQMESFALLLCTDQCTQKSFVTFNHEGLKKQMNQLQSSVSHDLMQNTFADFFEGVAGLESVEDSDGQSPIVNKTQFNNPPVPKTKVPGNPCNDPDQGAPSAADKRAAKCTIKKSPQCYKLQERFLLIQAGIQDERDELLEEIAMLENFCEETKKTLETTIANDQTSLSNSQTKLAAATEKEATAGETARQTATENQQLNNDLVKQMKTCSGNYINFETELCALKKIRGELYKMKGGADAGAAFFQDCEVSKWSPEECTKKCAGGEQKLTRSVLTHPNGGTKCLPLAAMKSCNNGPCPVDCKLSSWSGWSKCSAECGGGVSQRLREVKRAMKYGGKPCGDTSQTKSCNGQACEKDCDLTAWTKWTPCSKDCDGGTKKRQKFVKKAAEGAGKCADAWSIKRLEYKACNQKRCKLDLGDNHLECNKTVDIVLLIDGSGSLGKKGWAAEMKAANTFVDAFAGSNAKANMAVILYSGPRTWGGVRLCTGKSKNKVDQEKVCGIKSVTHFTDDMKKVKSLINGLTWPRGSTLTSLALLTAKAELALGRKNAQSIVIAITDGRPLSFRKTGLASKMVRKGARLIWVPVTKYAPLKYIKKWATRRWQENVVKVSSFKNLEKPDVVTHIIANICPKREPKVRFSRK